MLTKFRESISVCTTAQVRQGRCDIIIFTSSKNECFSSILLFVSKPTLNIVTQKHFRSTNGNYVNDNIAKQVRTLLYVVVES